MKTSHRTKRPSRRTFLPPFLARKVRGFDWERTEAWGVTS